jgi:hypothetical protein
MFDTEIRGEIKGAKIKVTEDGAFVFRTVRMALEREFDNEIAATIGKPAEKAREHIDDGSWSKVVIPISAVSARAVLSGKTKVALDKVTGVKATCSIGKAKEDEDAPLKVKLEFDFPFSAEAWAMLGAEAGTTIGITLTRNQLDLPGTSKGTPAAAAPPAETKANGKRLKTPKAKLGTKSPHGDDHAEAAGEITDPQQAATPEQAEEIRTQRLREQRAEDENAWTSVS